MLMILYAVDDFDNSKINKIIKHAQSKECIYYHSLFHKELSDNLTLQNSEKEILQLLSTICSFCFSKKSVLYDSQWYIDGKRSLNAEDLTEFDLSFLESLIDNVSDDELRSRIADILWTRKPHRKYANKYANIAVRSFLKSGRNFLKITSDGVPEVNQFFTRFERAVQIALSVKDNFRIKQIAKYLKCCLEKTPYPFKNDYLIECYLKLLKLTGSQNEFCLEFIENNLNKITNIHDKDRIFGIGVEVAKKLKQQEKINNFYRHKAKNLYEEANRFALEGKITPNSYIGASHWLKEALGDLKKINPKLTEDIILENSWEKLLTEFNKKMSEGLELVQVEFDASPLIEESNRRLEELKKYNSDILMTLRLFTKDRLLGYEDFSKKTEITLADTVSRVTIGNGAKEIPNSNPEKDRAVQKLSTYLECSVIRIEELRKNIIQNFNKDDLDQAIIFFIKDNPLLPQKKLNQIFAAIQFGFFEDWVVSSYIIPAQIESMLRVRLQNAGIYLLQTDKNLIQQDNLLGTILKDTTYREHLDNDELLGKNSIFHIEALLNHKHGANLRNEVYHGLCDDEFFTKSSNIYLWWLFLKIIIEAKLKSVEKEKC